MRFPFVVQPDLTARQLERYHRHIDSDSSGWYRRFTESIWRRHQHPSNAELSGWRGDTDQRRRLIHFYDEYGAQGRDFVLRNAYLHLVLDLPADDIDRYRAVIEDGLRAGEWRRTDDGRDRTLGRWQRGDLLATLRHRARHPEDEAHGHMSPAGYSSLDIVVRTQGYRLPAQRELGCGPSIEAGIPPLSTLHRIYGVSHPDYGFIFRAEDDGLLSLFRAPEAKYREMTDIYRACLLAEPTPFYARMRDLWARGHFVGPIITNNFDCQCADLGLPEISLRRYDWGPYYPTIEHDPRARSLLVIGVHADRRLVQMRARRAGLRVMFIDPERYVAPDGRSIAYPVEAPQDEDLLVRATADAAMAALHPLVLGTSAVVAV
jgi:hypothetical protein